MIGERNISWSTTVGMMYNAVLFPKTISVPSSGGAGVLSTTIQDPKSLIFPLCTSSRIWGKGGGVSRCSGLGIVRWSDIECVCSLSCGAFIHSQQQQLEAKKDTSPTSLSPSLMEITVFLEGGVVSSPLSLSLFFSFIGKYIYRLWKRRGESAAEQASKRASEQVSKIA